MIPNQKKNIEKVEKYGYVKIENFISANKISYYKNLINKNYLKIDAKKYLGIPERDKDDKILYNLQNKNFEFIKLITNKYIVNFAKYFLNDPYYRFIDKRFPNFNLLYFNARSSGKKLDLHIDCHLPFKGKRPNMMQFVILLEDSNKYNGCTIVVPKSHLSGKFTNRNSRKRIALQGKAGDMLIWDSRLWHGTFENKSKSSRWAIVATFGAWWIKPMMDMPRSLPNLIYEKCNNIQRQILGFCSIPPKNEFERINTKTGYNDLKKNVKLYYR